ncbi:MAG: PIG-L family deacetylase [Candidatus Eisenbacteria bacterium]|nr:PIG-L family deacetylase [Candidatus Eisenbacteria bacterium]
MVKALYIYPHPDDESFGPAPAMSLQRRQGHEVHLLTLTRGGATKQRHKHGYSVEEMGRVRFEEMQDVARVLDLSSMKVLDLPDGGLQELDPREIEAVIRDEVERLAPDVLVTYPVHGTSGFPDHIVTHAVVKRVYVEARERIAPLRRLAFLSVTEREAGLFPWPLKFSKLEEIDAVVPVGADDLERGRRCLDCYVTYKETIAETRMRELLQDEIVYEFYREDFKPPLSDIFDRLS